MRSFWIMAALAGACTASPALSEETCTGITSDLDRLSCYDKASGRTPTVTSTPTETKWEKREQSSKITDDKTIILINKSIEAVNCGWNKGAPISLVIRCHEKKTVLYFDTGCHMTSSEYNDYGKIEYRVDQKKAQSASGDTSTDNKSLGLWSGGKAIPVAKQLFGGKSLVVRMTPYSENPFTATFDISGLEEAIQPIRKECSW